MPICWHLSRADQELEPTMRLHAFARLLALALMVVPAGTLAGTPLELTFKGRVEPHQRTQVANQVTGMVSEVHFQPGQRVDRGELLFSLDSSGLQIDVEAAKASLAEANARLALAEDIAGRQARLLSRGSGAEARATQTALEADVARALVARAESALAAAELALKRTRITAPISGIARSRVAPGAFVEAEGGTVLGEIVQTDPVLVAYQVPYADRQKALNAAGTRSIKDLFSHIKIWLRLPSGKVYSSAGLPVFESAQLDEKTGMLTTWGKFPNPNGELIPGLEVTVRSEISAADPEGGNK
jgi:RND family efflux transporter MFP subunit